MKESGWTWNGRLIPWTRMASRKIMREITLINMSPSSCWTKWTRSLSLYIYNCDPASNSALGIKFSWLLVNTTLYIPFYMSMIAALVDRSPLITTRSSLSVDNELLTAIVKDTSLTQTHSSTSFPELSCKDGLWFIGQRLVIPAGG